MEKKILVLISMVGIVLVFGIFMFVNVSSVDQIESSREESPRVGNNVLEEGTSSYTESTKTVCTGNICRLESFGGIRFAQNEEGNWVDAGRVTSITQSSDDLSFNYFGKKGNKSIVFEVGAIYNGNYFSMQEVNQNIPELSFSFPVEETNYGNKYTLNIIDIPEVHQPNIESITLTYKSHSGFDVSNLDFGQRKVIAGEIMSLLFEDAKEEGFTISINKTEKRIYIGNITTNIINDTISIDPTITIQGPAHVEVAGLRRDAPNHGFGESTGFTVGAGLTNNHRMLLRFQNLSILLGDNAVVESAKVGIRAGTLSLAGNYTLYRVLKDWVEGNGTNSFGSDISGTGGMTTTNWDELAGFQWTTSGLECANDDGVNNTYDGATCDDPARRDRWATAEGNNVSIFASNVWGEWNISSNLVQGWYNGTFRNDGVVLINYNIGDSVFQTDDHTTFPPYLEVIYTRDTACDSGICNFGAEYLMEDLGLEDTVGSPPGEQAIQLKWNVTDLCNAGFTTIDGAVMQFFINAKQGSPDTDFRAELVLNQTWIEADSAANIDSHPLQNLTSGGHTSNTLGTYTNISILTQIKESCDRGDDTFSVRIEDIDEQVGSPIADTSDISTYIFGSDHLFAEVLLKFDSRESINMSRRPLLYANYSVAGDVFESSFIFPTPLQEKIASSTISFNMSLNETCGTGKDALILRIDDVNNTVCSSCPLSPETNKSFDKTGLADGNHTYDLLCNSAIHASNWTITDTGTLSTVFPISPGNASHDPTPASVEVSCNATSSSGIVNLTLWGDAHEIKNNFVILNSTNFTGGNENETASFIFQDILINDTYKWFCEAESVVGFKKNASIWNIGVGISKVYMVVTIDTEADDRGSEDTKFFMNLSFSNYFNDNLSETDSAFNATWRAENNDSLGNIPKITWYMMTHEAHCHATDKEGVLGEVDCNIIANIMYENTTFYSKEFYYKNKIESFGDDYGWHNHHSFWNGTTTVTDGGFWVGENNFTFQEGTNFFFDNFTNESSVVRAEKMVALFAYENALPWSSFRAGWLKTNVEYREFLSKNTPIDFGRLPILTENFWSVGTENFSTTDLNRFRCNAGTPTQDQVNNAFEYATNTTSVIICGYSHNYGGLAIKNNIEVILERADASALNFTNINYEWKTSKEAAQAYFRMTDTDAPEISISISGNDVVADFNEALYMAPALSILLNNGTSTNYSLQEMTKFNTTRYTFDKVNWENNTIGYRVRATDKSFNVNTSGFLESSINIIEPTTTTPFIVSDQATISVNFKFFASGEEQTTGVLVDSLFVNGTSECTLVGDEYYKSTTWEQNCTLPSTNFNETGLQDLTLTANHSLTPQITKTAVDSLNYGSANCWTYDSGKKFLSIPVGCLFESTLGNLFGV